MKNQSRNEKDTVVLRFLRWLPSPDKMLTSTTTAFQALFPTLAPEIPPDPRYDFVLM